MKKIKFSNTNDCVLVDDEDFEYLSQFNWHRNNCGYATRNLALADPLRDPDGVESQRILMHREILAPREGMMTDHINQDRIDNRKSNLRYATRSQNLSNRGPYKSRKYVGPSWNKRNKKWHVNIKHEKKEHWVGSFEDHMDALIAYNKAAVKIKGVEWAYQNPIEV